jgi:hypothetical protein
VPTRVNRVPTRANRRVHTVHAPTRVVWAYTRLAKFRDELPARTAVCGWRPSRADSPQALTKHHNYVGVCATASTCMSPQACPQACLPTEWGCLSHGPSRHTTATIAVYHSCERYHSAAEWGAGQPLSLFFAPGVPLGCTGFGPCAISPAATPQAPSLQHNSALQDPESYI